MHGHQKPLDRVSRARIQVVERQLEKASYLSKDPYMSTVSPPRTDRGFEDDEDERDVGPVKAG